MNRFAPPPPPPSFAEDSDESTPDTRTESGRTCTASASFTPIDPSEYFDGECVVDIPSRGIAVHVRTAGPPPGTPTCPVLLCVHGGGYCADSWAPLVRRLKPRFRLVCPDLRGHGATTAEGGDESLAIDVLVEDLIAFHAAYLGAEDPPLMLVGHSLGGAVVARVAATRRMKKVEGTCVVDVVEGTALSSLPYIMSVLQSRPASFASPEEAIRWAVRTHMTKCEESARVSVPGMLRKEEGGRWAWRTELAASEPHWQGWYRGLSEVFVSMPGYKLLALAGTDRLDKTLTMAQMRGSFQLNIFPSAGHAVHEDLPDNFAGCLEKFLIHFRIGQGPLVFPKKVL